MTALWEQPMWQATWAVAVAAALVGCWTDLRTRRIPNTLTAPLWVAGLVWSTASAGWEGFAESVLGCAIFALPYLVLYAVAGGGAGDAKMTGALGAWLGPIGGLWALGCVAVAGGVIAATAAVVRGRGRDLAINIAGMSLAMIGAIGARARRGPVVAWTNEQTQMMPYGLAIAAGTVLAAGGVWLWRA